MKLKTFKKFIEEDITENKREPKVNDQVFSKNDSEIYGYVSEVPELPSNVITVRMKINDKYNEYKIPRKDFKHFMASDKTWEFPNWYFS